MQLVMMLKVAADTHGEVSSLPSELLVPRDAVREWLADLRMRTYSIPRNGGSVCIVMP